MSLIREQGLSPGMVQVVAGAAGGPKWLVLNRLDRAIFLSWIQHRTAPLYLIGASIGAWRFAAMAQSNPLAAQQRFEQAYLHQRYSSHPTPAEVSREGRRMLGHFLDDRGIDDILNHPFLRMNIMAVRCKGPVASHSKALLGLGLVAAMAANVVNRKLLRLFFERALFYHPHDRPPFYGANEFPIHQTTLSSANLGTALIASGSIPLVMEGVTNPPHTPNGTYRDGGIIDYHLDIPFGADEGKIVLYPHFSDRIVPGWLDKQWTWRKPHRSHMKNVLLVCPSQRYIESLPNQKIPDRTDFNRYRGKDRERIHCWQTVVQKGETLADAFLESVASGKIKSQVQPLGL